MKIFNNDFIFVIFFKCWRVFVFCVLLFWFCVIEIDMLKKVVVNKLEIKEVLVFKRDRIIGGIGGGGFMGGKEKGEVCFFEYNLFF